MGAPAGSIHQDLRDKNVTLLLGYNHGHDTAGRTDTPFSVFSRTLDIEGIKTGATFLLDRKTIASVVADGIFENGDPSKPYRYVPLFEPGTSVPNGASIGLVTTFRVAARPLEQLPLSRQRYAGSLRLAHRFGTTSTLRFDERLATTTALGAQGEQHRPALPHRSRDALRARPTLPLPRSVGSRLLEARVHDRSGARHSSPPHRRS